MCMGRIRFFRSMSRFKERMLPNGVGEAWAAAGFKDTLLRWKVKPESGYGNKTAIQPGVQA